MLQNAQNSSRKNQDIRMFAKTMSEQEAQRAYRQSMQELVASLHGELVLPDTPDYESARGVWNGAADRHPALIVRPVNAADVITAINFAREQDIEVSVRSGGHSLAGYGTNDGGLVIDLSLMKAITVDPERRIARIEPGLTWGEVASTLQHFGLALTSGDTSSVGVGGLLLGGGIGWMVRKYGLTIDRLRAVELVTADGAFLRASANEHSELFWGLRGGGGNFGVATAFEVDLHLAGMVLGGAIFYDATDVKSLIRAYAHYAAAAPDELTTEALLMYAPPAPFLPQAQQGKLVFAIQLCYSGDLAEGERVVAPLRALRTPIADLVAPMPYPAIFPLTEDDPMRGFAHDGRSLFLETLNDEALDTLAQEAVVFMAPGIAVQLRVLGGAMGRVPADATAFAHRDAQMMIVVAHAGPRSANTAFLHASMEQIWQAIWPYRAGVYVGFLMEEGEQRIHEAYPAATYARLAALKK